MESQTINIYTDGGCLGNPGKGAWAFVIESRNSDSTNFESSGYQISTTNNRMEIQAAIEALSYAKTNFPLSKIALYTDSKYLKQGISEWILVWKRNGWVRRNKVPVLNKDLWLTLDALNEELDVNWCWVPGHSNVELNNRCDDLVKLRLGKK